MKILTALLALLLLVRTASADPLEDGVIAFNAQDYNSAYDLLLPLAEQGNDEAQYLIGKMFHLGLGREVDYLKSIAWLEKAASQGHKRANMALGNIYGDGMGVEKDETKAFSYLTFSATHCEPDAAAYLGLLYQDAQPPLRDVATGIGWLYVAESLGSDIGRDGLIVSLGWYSSTDVQRGRDLAPSLKATVRCSD